MKKASAADPGDGEREETMLELLILIIFVWLLGKVISLALKLTWGAAKIAAGLLTALPLPLLAVGLVFAGGLLLLIPLGLVGLAAGILGLCT